MAATLAGEAAIRIVPSLRNFRSRVQSELSRKPIRFDIDIRPKVDTSLAEAQLDKFRAKERANAINLRAKVDINEAKAAFSRVEHIFKRSAVAKALRLNIVVLGGDAIYAAAAALGSLSAAADVAVKSLVAIPGALSAAGVAAGVFAIAIQDVKKGITALQTEQDQSADKARALANAQRDSVKAHRDVGRAIKDVGSAYRDAARDAEDLLHAVRRGSLDEAGALLNLQDALDDLAGGATNLKELRRQQLGVASSLDDLNQVRTQNIRNGQDYNKMQQEGINQNDKVVAALDSVQDAMDRVADSQARVADSLSTKTDTGAFSRLSPSAQEFAHAVADANSAWVIFGQSLQEPVFEGQAKNLTDTVNMLRNLGPELRGVAHQLGGVFLDLGAALRKDDNKGNLQGIIGQTETGIATLRRSIDPLVSAWLRMSNSSAFPQLAGWIERLSTRFDNWTQKIAADGSLEKWIHDGINGLDSLVNSGTNIVVFINNIAAAWRTAGGESSGVITSLENVTKSLADWSASISGQNSLVNYFRGARDFIDQVVDSLKGMGPTVQSITSFVREWSTVMLEVLSTGLQLTAWVQENFGVIKPLLFLWLTWRTVAPLVGAVSGAVQNLTKITSGLGNAGVPVFSNMNRGLQQLHSNMDLLKNKTSSAVGPVSNLTSAQGALLRSTTPALQQTNNLTKAFSNSMGPIGGFTGAVGTATTKVGLGNIGQGLRGAVGGLAAFLGPQAAFAVAMAAGLWAVNKLGEGHRNAARDANAQADALDRVKQSLDSVTGAATKATTAETAKQFQQGVTIPNFPGGANRKVFEDLQRSGLSITPQDLLGATNPTQIDTQDRVFSQIDSALKSKVEGSEAWKRGKDFWEQHGVNSDTMAKAMGGDQAALAAVDKAEGAAFDPHNTGNRGDRTFQQVKRQQFGISDLGSMISQTNSFDVASVGIAARNTLRANQQGGADIQAQNQAAFGPATFKPGKNIGGPGARLYKDANGVKVETAGTVPAGWELGVPPAIGTASILADGRGQILLSPEAAHENIEGFAGGGYIRGMGTGTSDSNVIGASAGEFVLRKAAVDALGVHNLDKLNSYQGGGPIPFIPGPVSPIQVPPAGATPTTFPNGAPFLPSTPSVFPPGSTPRSVLGAAGYPLPAPWAGASGAHPLGVAAASTAPNMYKSWYPTPAPVTPPAPKPAPQTTKGSNAPPAVTSPTTGISHGPGGNSGYTGSPSTDSDPVNYPALPTASSQAYQPYPMSPQVVVQTPAGPMVLSTPPSSQSYGLPSGTNTGGYGNVAGSAAFPPWAIQLGQMFGVTPSTYAGHQETDRAEEGYAANPNHENRGIDWSGSPENMQRFADYLKTVPGMEQVIWNGAGVGTGDTVEIAGGRSQPGYFSGDLAGHGNHVHTRQSAAIPLPGQAAMLPGGSVVPGAADLGLLGGFINPDGSGTGSGTGSGKKSKDPFDPDNIRKFLGGQMENVGQDLLGIGLSLLQGFTGIDMSGLVGAGQQIAGHYLGKDDKSDEDKTGLTSGEGLDPLITSNLDAFGVGNGSIGSTMDPTSWASVLSSGNGGPKDAVHQAMLAAGFPESEWPALEELLQSESSWDPKAKNKSSGASGLFQFLGHENDKYGQLGGYSPDPSQQAIAGLQYIKDRYGTPSAALKFWKGNNPHWYARGGRTGSGLIRASRGEYKMSAPAVSRLGMGFMHHLNSFGVGGGVGLPFLPNLPAPAAAPPPPPPSTGAPAPFHLGPGGPQVPGAPAPVAGPGAPPPPVLNMQPPPPPPPPMIPGGPGGLGAPTEAVSQVPGQLPMAPGASDPNAPKQFSDASAPVVDPNNPNPDMRSLLGTVGPAPQSNEHNASFVKGGIEGAFQAAGNAGAMAASIGTMGMGGMAGSMISAGAQMAGQIASGAMNILSSAGVGSIMDIGTQGTPSGIPLIPQRAPQQFGQLPSQYGAPQPVAPQGGGGPAIVNNYNGGIHTQNMDEWQRRQTRVMDQQSQPYISKYSTI